MSNIKKIVYLLLITVCISAGTQAQQISNDQKLITLTKFKVYENNTQVIIDWSTEGVTEVNYWQVQYSADGQRFSTIALVFGPDPRQKGDHFQYKGKMRDAVAGGKACYKVTPVDAKGEEINTEIIRPAK